MPDSIHGIDIHSNNDEALMEAIRNNHLDVVKYLLDPLETGEPDPIHGIDIHTENEMILTLAYIYASMNNNIEIINYLKNNM